MKKILASLLIVVIISSCTPSEPEFSYSTYLVDNTAWWAEDGCSNYKQLHFKSDKTGFCNVENTCSCTGLIDFNWSVSNENVLTITVTDDINCSGYDDGYTETVILSKEQFSLLGSNWHQ